MSPPDSEKPKISSLKFFLIAADPINFLSRKKSEAD
ncbi:hypothetical protein VIM7927_03645 [Vibrio mangrovi]|uniref:Uncharacterized protein n=1 Tax=Vibrio mangrovi TaxID=474394 RepID=A0A1Y6IXC5_9VIBR|nr:hypothetical protein VIM7927_03645 [Vibrio mangrovi]